MTDCNLGNIFTNVYFDFMMVGFDSSIQSHGQDSSFETKATIPIC